MLAYWSIWDDWTIPEQNGALSISHQCQWEFYGMIILIVVMDGNHLKFINNNADRFLEFPALNSRLGDTFKKLEHFQRENGDRPQYLRRQWVMVYLWPAWHGWFLKALKSVIRPGFFRPENQDLFWPANPLRRIHTSLFCCRAAVPIYVHVLPIKIKAP